jgi:Family of unknown function (DUF6345)
MVRIGVEWVNRFPGPCTATGLSYCDDTSVGFLNGMRSRGHTQVFNWGDSNAWETDFRDPAFGGNDTNWIDNVDFAHFSSHGATSSANVFNGSFGTAHTDCRWRSDRARFGNRSLKWLAIDACQSLELSRNIIATWQNAYHGLHLIVAFTDLVSDSWWTGSRGYNFGRRAGNNERIVNAWLDESYSWWLDDNPVGMSVGTTRDDAINRRDNERINSNFPNIPNSEARWFAWKWRD